MTENDAGADEQTDGQAYSITISLILDKYDHDSDSDFDTLTSDKAVVACQLPRNTCSL